MLLWLDYLTQAFSVLGLIGAGFGIYVFATHRDRWAIAAAISCTLGVVLPFWGYTIPGVLANVLVPYTIPGAILSFVLNIVPWYYLLPYATPKPKGRQRRPGNQPRRSGGRR